MTTRVEELLKKVRQLDAEEQEQLRQALTGLLRTGSAPPEDQLDELLVERGLLGAVPPPAGRRSHTGQRKLVEIVGKPLSETIIEDRR